jgi:hypothetical protein
MSLRERLAVYEQAFQTTVAVATCRESLGFGDLYWPPLDPQVELLRLTNNGDPGVIFETPTRVVVIEEHSGELRYYAGGWRSHESRICLEQDRIWAEGQELGVFPTPGDGILFAEAFLVRELALQDITTARRINHRQETDKSWQAQSSK